MKFSLPLCMMMMLGSLVPAVALAQGDISCVAGQFAEQVDHGKPSGGAEEMAASKRATYFVDVANPGAPTQVTLVWTLDGKEVQRQSLDVGSAPHWHTWGSRPLGNAKDIRVELLDASGASLKTDSMSLTPKAAAAGT
ncbi:MAG: hypothetical protein ABI461_20250 [Polyangiaceae bacterium]